MGKRKNRSVSTATRQKISKSLKEFYRSRWSQSEREQRCTKLSNRLKAYWANIPIASNNDG